MILQLLRHADAEPLSSSDFDRALTHKGIAEAKKVAEFIDTHNITPNLMFTSPLVRAIQTAEIVGKTIGMRPRILDCLACGMDIDVLLRALLPHSREKTILVVGHEPDLSLAVADLLGVADPVLIDVRKASLLGSEIMNWHEPSGSLLYSVPVSLM